MEKHNFQIFEDPNQLWKYRGVKGWLLFFCIILTILTPLMFFINTIFNVRILQIMFENENNINNFLLVVTLLNFLLVILSMRAGLFLWVKHPRAVKVAKNFLYFVLGLSIISLALPFLLGLKKEVSTTLFIFELLDLVGTIIFVSIWYAYLALSKRVKYTYMPVNEFELLLKNNSLQQT
ncbi:MAG: DUF2569 family protein [Cytophagaceae bacterium]|nr:DUF2569 family protein [Cytophagaceae bacterium]MDW8456986.1 DUF2569 family protein [Cytophagaceae bacterium]